MTTETANTRQKPLTPKGIDALHDTLEKVLKSNFSLRDKALWTALTYDLEDTIKRHNEGRDIQAVKIYRKALEARDKLFSTQGRKSKETYRKSVDLFVSMVKNLTSEDDKENCRQALQEIGDLHLEYRVFEQQLEKISAGQDAGLASENHITMQPTSDGANNNDRHNWASTALQTAHHKIAAYTRNGRQAEDILHHLRHTDLQLRQTPSTPKQEQIEDLHHSIYNLSQSFALKIDEVHSPIEKNYWQKLYRAVNRGLREQLEHTHKSGLKHLKQELTTNYYSPQNFSIDAKPSLLHQAWTAIKRIFSVPNLREAWDRKNHQPTLQEIITQQQSQPQTNTGYETQLAMM